MKDIDKIIYSSALNSVDELRKNLRLDINSIILSSLAYMIDDRILANRISNDIRNASGYQYTGSGEDDNIMVLVDGSGNYVVSGNNEYILIQL